MEQTRGAQSSDALNHCRSRNYGLHQYEKTYHPVWQVSCHKNPLLACGEDSTWSKNKGQPQWQSIRQNNTLKKVDLIHTWTHGSTLVGPLPVS